MGLLDGGVAAAFGSMFAGFYLDASLHRASITDDGAGGGSVGFADAQPVKAQLDQATQAMRDSPGYVDTDQRILVLAYGIDAITTDDEITVDGLRWSIASVTQDPAGACYELRGRRA